MTSMQIAAVVLPAFLLAAGAGLALFTRWTARRVQHALPPQGRFVNVSGVMFHVREQGDGPPLLLIHGLAGQMRHYTYGVTERLARQYRVVTVDRPGSGYSVRDKSVPADLSAQAGAIAELIDKLQLGRPFVVGHSLGGAVSLALALEHPRQVAGLALLAPLTHLPEDGRPPAAFRALTIATPWLRTLFAWTLAVPASIAGSRVVLAQVFGPDAVPHDFATRGGGLLTLRPSHFIAASQDLQAVPLRLPALVARYPELNLPVDILFGRQDRILDWKTHGQGLADKAKGARLRLVDGGHMLPVTHPDLTARFIGDAARRAGLARRASAPAPVVQN
ncbi:MAG TPA: alpha/beta fold hydrolase [Noviherbaspirillum sp.]|uniref:alpha/beta fold hydrolase n=1 Tax=Noviherbaspirillum sp. TaxID=1926288 RepID=UPI002D537842|nr:alpha/beta fold hydrolase [Noviherbaspirillum sp.]HYD96855.1 alpha/beta fold hydrolase [Noviherbaspirillum sp.]